MEDNNNDNNPNLGDPFQPGVLQDQIAYISSNISIIRRMATRLSEFITREYLVKSGELYTITTEELNMLIAPGGFHTLIDICIRLDIINTTYSPNRWMQFLYLLVRMVGQEHILDMTYLPP